MQYVFLRMYARYVTGLWWLACVLLPVRAEAGLWMTDMNGSESLWSNTMLPCFLSYLLSFLWLHPTVMSTVAVLLTQYSSVCSAGIGRQTGATQTEVSVHPHHITCTHSISVYATTHAQMQDT